LKLKHVAKAMTRFKTRNQRK